METEAPAAVEPADSKAGLADEAEVRAFNSPPPTPQTPTCLPAVDLDARPIGRGCSPVPSSVTDGTGHTLPFAQPIAHVAGLVSFSPPSC
jgi:hypothetical protein